MNKGGFSGKRATGVTRAKSRISRKTRVPLTKSGRQRKVGRMMTGGGCLLRAVMLGLMLLRRGPFYRLYVVGSILMLGEAAPRNPEEAITVALDMPGVPAPQDHATIAVRRGFIGTIHTVEYGPGGYEGRYRVSAVITGWTGDTPRVTYEVDR